MLTSLGLFQTLVFVVSSAMTHAAARPAWSARTSRVAIARWVVWALMLCTMAASLVAVIESRTHWAVVLSAVAVALSRPVSRAWQNLALRWLYAPSVEEGTLVELRPLAPAPAPAPTSALAAKGVSGRPRPRSGASLGPDPEDNLALDSEDNLEDKFDPTKACTELTSTPPASEVEAEAEKVSALLALYADF
jgi:hypothetical protein